MKTFDSIASVPLCYIRSPKPVLPYNIKLSPSFHDTLHNCFTDLFSYPWMPKASAIITAGGYVDKPGEHGGGRAIDIDGFIWWEDGTHFNTAVLSSEQDAKLYYRIQSVFMSWFGLVLGRDYNKAHEDHWHIDASRSIAFRHNSRACVSFIQASYNVLHSKPGKGIEVDGSWGPATREAMRSVVPFPGDYPVLASYINYLQACHLDQQPKTLEEQVADLRKRVEALEARNG